MVKIFRSLFVATRVCASQMVRRVGKNMTLLVVLSGAYLIVSVAIWRTIVFEYTAVAEFPASAAPIPHRWALESEGLRRGVVARLDLGSHYGNVSAGDAMRLLDRHTRIDDLGGGGVRLGVTDTSATFAASLLRAYVEGLLQLNRSARLGQASAQLHVVERRRQLVERYLVDAEAQLERAEIRSALNRVPPAARLAIATSAPILAANALRKGELEQLDGPGELVRMQQYLSIMELMLADGRGDSFDWPNRSLVQLADAVRAAQDAAYWRALAIELDAQGDELRLQSEQEIAVATNESSEPALPERWLAMFAGLLNLFGIVGLVCFVSCVAIRKRRSI